MMNVCEIIHLFKDGIYRFYFFADLFYQSFYEGRSLKPDSCIILIILSFTAYFSLVWHCLRCLGEKNKLQSHPSILSEIKELFCEKTLVF